MSAYNHPDSILYAYRAVIDSEMRRDFPSLLFWSREVSYRLWRAQRRIEVENTLIRPLIDRLVENTHLPISNYKIVWESTL